MKIQNRNTRLMGIALILWMSVYVNTSVYGGAETQRYRGYYVFGHEVRSFQPCGSDQVYWVSADGAIWQKLRSEHKRLTTKPYEPIFIEVQGHVIGRAAEGLAADYSGQIILKAVEVARAKQNNDCNASAATDDNLLGIVWKWQQTLYNNDQRAVPNDPSGYTIVFQPDGTLAIRADCNRAGGNYTLENSSLNITVTHSTRAMCPPDSLEQTFLKDLDAATIYFMRKGQLYIDLKYDTGTMRFSK
jgi:heat shock protein HslJ